jgi:HEAT repeat protein
MLSFRGSIDCKRGLIGLIAFMVLSVACSHSKDSSQRTSTQDLLKVLAQANNEEVRAGAARKLASVSDAPAAVGLIRALNDKSELVQSAAATALRGSKAPGVADALWTSLQDRTRRQSFRLSAAVALASLHDARAAGFLVDRLPDAPDEASQALKDLGPPAIPALANGLRYLETMSGCAKVLASIPGGLDPLIPLLAPGESRATRLMAAGILAESDDSRVVAALKAIPRSTELEVSAAAYRLFIRLGEPGTESDLIKALNTYGTAQMAADFISSGNPALKKAGEDWRKVRSVSFAARRSDLPEVYWAGIEPGIKRLGLYHFDESATSASGTAPVQSAAVSFVPGKWGTALSVGRGGILKYPLPGNLDFLDGTIEMWISPRLDGNDPIYAKYNHALLLYNSPTNEQFLVSEATFGGFYAGSVINHQFKGSGGGSIGGWKAGTWHHIAFTYSSMAKRQSFYVDGVQVAQNTGAMPAPDPHAGTFTVGCDPYGNWTAFVVDELQISSGEKSAEAIRGSARRSTPFADR